MAVLYAKVTYRRGIGGVKCLCSSQNSVAVSEPPFFKASRAGADLI